MMIFRCICKYVFLGVSVSSLMTTHAQETPFPEVSAGNVTVTEFAKGECDAMPLGNGSLGISAWMERNGILVVQLNHTDTFSETSRLLKIGRIRLKLDPIPDGTRFKQVLFVDKGSLEIFLGATHIKVIVEPNRPVVRIMGNFAISTKFTVMEDGWRQIPTLVSGPPPQGLQTRKASVISSWSIQGTPAEYGPLIDSADILLSERESRNGIGWFHRNNHSVTPMLQKLQGCENLPGVFDPLLGRTFGAWIEGPGLIRKDSRTLESKTPSRELDLRITCPVRITPSSSEWVAEAKRIASDAPSPEKAMANNTDYWNTFWKRSWVSIAGEKLSIPLSPFTSVTLGNQTEEPIVADLAGATIKPGVLSDSAIELLAKETKTQTETTTPTTLSFAPETFAKGLTISAWVKYHEENELNSGLKKSWCHILRSQGLSFECSKKNRSLTMTVDQQRFPLEGVLKLGKWQHFAATYNPELGQVRVYVDGELKIASACESDQITKSYQRQRFMLACQSRGEFPPKFNGGIFTVAPNAALNDPGEDPDFRRWGDCYWFQNTRLIYHPMLMSGDLDLMEPFWKFYKRTQRFAESRSQLWYKTSGSWIPETMTVSGTYAGSDYGWNRKDKELGDVASKYVRWIWSQSPELIDLLLKRYEWSQDERFAREELLPQAESLLCYIDTRFRRDEKGVIVITPTQSVETYIEEVVNDTPLVAGLRSVLPRLIGLPQKLTTPGQRDLFKRLYQACPEVPVGERVSGKNKTPIRMILPAEKFKEKNNNSENAEQYAVWPFGLFRGGKPDLEMAKATVLNSKFNNKRGWDYAPQALAMLGMTQEVKNELVSRCRNSHSGYAFPATWGPNFDWLPDNCHGGNILTTTQLMLMHCNDQEILLLPAWPQEWDVDFRLHAPWNTVVEATVRKGIVKSLKVIPESQYTRVKIAAPFRLGVDSRKN